eukprot:335114-Prymnesium_polylepis.2
MTRTALMPSTAARTIDMVSGATGESDTMATSTSANTSNQPTISRFAVLIVPRNRERMRACSSQRRLTTKKLTTAIARPMPLHSMYCTHGGVLETLSSSNAGDGLRPTARKSATAHHAHARVDVQQVHATGVTHLHHPLGVRKPDGANRKEN